MGAIDKNIHHTLTYIATRTYTELLDSHTPVFIRNNVFLTKEASPGRFDSRIHEPYIFGFHEFTNDERMTGFTIL